MTKKELTDTIKRFALEEAGFDLVGVTSARLPSRHGEAVERWIEKGRAGSMHYLVRDGARRAEAEKSLPGARSVISLAVNYYHPEDAKPEGTAVGKVAKYAYGADYHRVIEKKLKKLRRFLEAAVSELPRIKIYVDTGPILEKAFAMEAGLGFFGKNTNLITKDYGSFVFLASLITDVDLEPDAPATGGCGSCRLCIDACPTGALLPDYEMDATRCISYLTIESKEAIPDSLKKGVGEWLFGCDICQDVCPYNVRRKVTRHARLYPEKKAGTWVDLEKVLKLDDDKAFLETFQGSPLMRAKRQGLTRNARAVKANAGSAPVSP